VAAAAAVAAVDRGYSEIVRVLMLEAPESMLDERRRLGLDGQDEMWDGVLHMVPPAGGPPQRIGARLLMALGPLAEQRGLVAHYEAGLFRSGSDYRVPDQFYCRAEALSERGAESAELVVEIRSPGDETYQKVDFYADLGVRELLIVHPGEHRVELLRAVNGRLLPVSSDADGTVRSDVLGVGFVSAGEALRLTWLGGSAEL